MHVFMHYAALINLAIARTQAGVCMYSKIAMRSQCVVVCAPTRTPCPPYIHRSNNGIAYDRASQLSVALVSSAEIDISRRCEFFFRCRDDRPAGLSLIFFVPHVLYFCLP